MMDLVAAGLDELHERIAGRFGRAEPRSRVREYVSGLVTGLERKNGWTLAEWAGEVGPDGMQRRLRRAVWSSGGCHSWYLDDQGVNRTLWQGFSFEYWARTRRARPDDYSTLR